MYFQPFIHLPSQQVIGAECLLRWRTPDGKFIPPDVFIPIAEHSGLMNAIGERVIRTALNWRKRISAHVSDDFRVAINVSQVQFADPEFISSFEQILTESGVAGSQVELELTESIAIESQDFAMAKTIIAMAKHLNLKIIAEGIETREQMQALLECGCQDGQGYLFSPPLPETEFIAWLTDRFHCEVRVRHQQGHWIWVLDSGMVTERDVHGDFSRLYQQILPEYREKLADHEVRCMQYMEVFRAEAKFLLPDGRERWILIVSSPRRLPNNHLVFDGIEIDITEGKQTNQSN